MPLTLMQAAIQSYNEGKERLSEIQTQFALNSQFLSVLPFRTISGNTLEFPLEEELPDIGTRGYNEGFAEDAGELREEREFTAIMGGDLDVDRELVNEMGAEIRTQREDMKVRSLGLNFDRLVVKGVASQTSKEFNGLQRRLGSGTQVIAAGNTSGGDPLSLSALDQLYYQVTNPTHWIFPKALAVRLPKAARTVTMAGTINFTTDEFGYQVTTYAGLPILIMDQDNKGNAIMPFTEDAPGGGSSSTSVYLVSIGSGRMEGIQTREMDARDLGELESKPVLRTRVDWRAGICVMNPRSIGRIWGIKNADIVA